MEKRGLKYHRGRVGEALREEIETLVEGELADPRIGLVSVTAVHIADDGRSAQVWVNVEGSDEDADESLEGLEAAKEYIRHELVERLHLKTRSGTVFPVGSRGAGKGASRRIVGAGEETKQDPQGNRWKKGIAASRMYSGRSDSTSDSC